MRMSKTNLSIAAAALILSSPVAFAQSRDGGMVDKPLAVGATAVPGATTAPKAMTTDTTTTTGRSDSVGSATTHAVSKTTSPSVGDATGGPVGGPKAQN